jgi:hypothetical protein
MAAAKTKAPKASEPKAEPLTVASNDELHSMLASINELLKLQLRLSGFDFTVDTGLIL